MKNSGKELTKAEEQVMQVLWDLENGFVKDILENLPAPKPAYNTVSTIVRILESKDFVGYEAFGKSHRYFPKISKEAYAQQITDRLVKSYFGGSIEKMLSFFVEKKNMSISDLDELLNNLKKEKE